MYGAGVLQLHRKVLHHQVSRGLIYTISMEGQRFIDRGFSDVETSQI